MTRRVTAGIVGGAAVAGLQAFTTRITSAANLDITVDPAGTGRFLVAGPAQIENQNPLRFADSDSSNWVAFQSPATVAANVTWTLPATDGSNNQVLTTNGSGSLTWTTSAISVANEASDSNLNYPLFTTATSGTITTGRVNSTKLDYQPSTGRLRLLGNTASTSTTTGTLVVTGGIGVSGRVTANNIQITATTASSSVTTGALVVAGGAGIAGTITANSIAETSSIVLKENINPIENALESVLKLNGVTYDRKDNQEHEAGLIAEWVDQVLPDLVTRDQDGGVIGIKYSKLTAYLIEAVKALKTEINELRNK